MIKEILFIALMATITFASKKPEWVKERPKSVNDYIGIAVVEKNNYQSKDQWIKAGKLQALNDISSAISVTLSSSSKVHNESDDNTTTSLFNEDITALTKANLEGYDFVGSWENRDEYWVYYKLNKLKWAQIEKRRMEEKSLKADSYIKSGTTFEREGKFVSAIHAYINAFNAIAPVIYLTPKLPNNTIPLATLIDEKIMSLLNSITFNAKAPIYSGIAKDFSKNEPTVKVLYDEEKAVRNYPILIEKFPTATGNNGQFKLTAQAFTINGASAEQLITLQTNISKLLPSSELLNITKGWFTGHQFPTKTVRIIWKKPSVYIESIQEGYEDVPYEKLANGVKKELASIGYEIARFPEDADYRLIIKSNTREAGNMGNLYFSYLDVTWSLYSKEGDEVASESMKPIKGGALSYDDADVKAYIKGESIVAQRIIDILKEKK